MIVFVTSGKTRLSISSPPSNVGEVRSETQVSTVRVEAHTAASSHHSMPVAAASMATTCAESAVVLCTKQCKEVSFCGFVKVVLIPCVADYREANLCDVLWWTASDMKGFHNETVHSLRRYMTENQVNDRKRALRMLLEEEAVVAASALGV